MWLPSSPKFFPDGFVLLPPANTGIRPRTFAADEYYQSYSWYRDDRVYVWPYEESDPLDVLGTMAWNQATNYLYEVGPVDVAADGDVIASGAGSRSCASAVVLRCLHRPVEAASSGREPLPWIKLDVTTVPPDVSYRPESREWARRVDWARVNRVAVELLERGCFDDLDELALASADLSSDDRMGLQSLYAEPIGAIPEQVTNGIHRMEAMRAQGVRFTVALD